MDNALCGTKFCIIVGLFLLAAFALFAFAIITNNKHKKKLEELTLYQMHISANIDQSIPEILDLIIREAFMDYQAKYLAMKEEGFINEEREIEIRRGLVELVTQRISQAALDKISLFYNIANIADIIADKIYMIVMEYVASHNSKFYEDK